MSLVLDSLRNLQKERQVILYADVIMEHHLYLIASSPELRGNDDAELRWSSVLNGTLGTRSYCARDI